MSLLTSLLISPPQKGKYDPYMVPTVGFNMHKVKKGKVSISVWDLGGQKPYIGMWTRYCRGADCIVFVVDAADAGSLMVAAEELHRLMAHPTLDGIPLLVLLNKNDLPEAIDPAECVNLLELSKIPNREVAWYSISCKNINNIEKALTWLTERSKSK